MARTPPVTRESIPEEHRATFDEYIKDRGGVPDGGPGSVLLNAPEVAKRALGLAGYLRGETSLSPRIRELAMLVAACENDCQYIWNAHAAAGRQAGLSDALVDAMRDKKDLPNIPEDEAAVINYGREFYRTHRVSDATFQAALQQFGAHGLTNLTNLMGYYALLAFNANCFQIDLPAERSEPTLPI